MDNHGPHQSTEEELAEHKKNWRPDQKWQFKREYHDTWHDLPKGYRPGWFFDTKYRQKPQ
jgi:hypothetical protein